MLTRARAIAELLGLPQEAVRDLQRHGFLRRLDLDEREIRQRLWWAHLGHLRKARLSLPAAGRRDPAPGDSGLSSVPGPVGGDHDLP